jgi:hypothetical protein
MPTAKDFVSQNPEFFRNEIAVKQDWLRVKNQTIEHVRYLETSELLNTNRPREDEDIKEYRNNIKRRITAAPINKYRTKTSRIFRSSGLAVSEESLSSSLKEYLDSMPYRYLNRPTNLNTYIFEVVYSRAIEDANAVEIILPYNPSNPDIAPILPVSAGGVMKNADLPIKKVIVPCEDIIYFDADIFSWYGGMMPVPGENSHTRNEKWYWLLDNEWFYRYVPVRIEQGKVVYEVKVWYPHDTGMGDEKIVPVNVVPGDIVYSETGNIAYQVSFVSGMVEYFDEAISRFSDGQAVWYTTAFPVQVMEETDCTAPGCFNGYVQNPNSKAKSKTISCSTCGGSGKMARPSPYGVIIKKKTVEGESTTGKAYELISPDTNILDLTYKIPFDLIQKGERQSGLDVLEHKIEESGVSREMKFEDMKDRLADNAEKIAAFTQAHLFFTECLLNPDRKTRKMPKVNTPTDFQLKTSYDLKKDVDDALPADRLHKTMIYFRNIYKDNNRLLKVYETAYKYAPSLVYDWPEAKEMEGLGVLETNDLVKRSNAINIFTEMSKLATWDTMTDQRAFELADEMMMNRGLFKPERLTLVNANGEES